MKASKIVYPILLAAMFLTRYSLAADIPNPDDFKCGPIDCDTLKDHPDARYNKIVANIKDRPSFGEYLQAIPKLRADFWESYPNQPSAEFHQQVREEFAQALFCKDIYYLHFHVIARTIAENPNRLTGKDDDLPSQVVALMGGEIDGGIPVSAQPAFFAWVNAVRDALGPMRTSTTC